MKTSHVRVRTKVWRTTKIIGNARYKSVAIVIEKWVNFKRDYLEISFLRENCGYDGSDDCRRNQSGLWNYDYFSITQWRPDQIWPSSHKEIWNFVKEVMCPFLPSFVTGMYVVSTGRLCSQKTGLQTYSNFMHTFLTKVVPDNLKACQICKLM